MRKDEIQEFKNMVHEIADAPNKREAELLRKRAHFACSDIAADVGPYLAGKLQQAIDHAYDAAGQTTSREHWLGVMTASLYVFERQAGTKPSEPMS